MYMYIDTFQDICNSNFKWFPLNCPSIRDDMEGVRTALLDCSRADPLLVSLAHPSPLSVGSGHGVFLLPAVRKEYAPLPWYYQGRVLRGNHVNRELCRLLP